MSRMQRTKGKVFERKVAADLTAHFGVAIKRTYGQSREGHDAPDVDGEEWPWWTECTHSAKPNILGKFRQAEEASDGRPPLVIAKQTRGPTLVVMTWGDFLNIVAPVLRKS